MDFLVRRADGTGVRLHPQKTKNKIDAYDEHPHPQPVPTPRRGVGKSDWKGTFKHYKVLGVTRTLRFAPVSRRVGGRTGARVCVCVCEPTAGGESRRHWN